MRLAHIIRSNAINISQELAAELAADFGNGARLPRQMNTGAGERTGGRAPSLTIIRTLRVVEGVRPRSRPGADNRANLPRHL